MPQVNIRLSPELHEAFYKACEERGETVTNVLRQAVERFCDMKASQDDEKRQAKEPAREIFNTLAKLPPRKADPKIRGWAADGSPIYDRPSNPKAKKS